MSRPNQKTCLVCAWRANCQKRFNRGSDVSLHCPDFSEDLTLRRSSAQDADEDSSELSGKK
ncbi:hypothetical protein [Geothermobacter hydrogeniphilus]|uniref:Uncharacterized protein n=1 Tax=Geothermobacter hydrogeniphilus TaxID=1969733 RepID=A0A1X0YD98_9BACT|nr:hypothetical protein [Geothermobacter hydrogeniphilus]ORJ63053.1 hypothetical protein B5V00_03125 [Geothermobacter hydrogeniphilus]